MRQGIPAGQLPRSERHWSRRRSLPVIDHKIGEGRDRTIRIGDESIQFGKNFQVLLGVHLRKRDVARRVASPHDNECGRGPLQVADEIVVTRPTDRGEHRALHGLTRSLVANMVEGVTEGYQKVLEIQGVGYRAQLKGRDLESRFRRLITRISFSRCSPGIGSG